MTGFFLFAIGHAQAYDYLYDLSHQAPLTEEIICHLHQLFYQQIDLSEQANIAKCQYLSVVADMQCLL